MLEKINAPQDLKGLSLQELKLLAEEIRARILAVVSRTGGHLASSLGSVELIIALHYCLNSPRDKIIFDVGHQAYAHKIITGRNKNFATLRQYGGLSGFPSKEESEHDPFTVGHSSNAVSLALGLSCARDYLPAEEHFKTTAVIGDGSLSGGLCFEGLNNAGHLKKDLTVVLNTNELSIAPNTGALSTYLNKIISMPVYNRFRDSLEGFVKSRIPRGSRLIKIANKFEEGLKGLFVPGMLFEELGFRYFGPFDGHNLEVLIPAFKNIFALKGPLLVHVVTKKGKGYSAAEDRPVSFHGIGPFTLDTGELLAKQEAAPQTYTEVFSLKLCDLAKDNPRIVAVTAAMPEGTGLDRFRDLYPERFFDVGIAEGHAVCFAAGLARQGLRPVFAVYSTFLQRAYDQIIEDVALQGLPVVFCLDRSGIVGEDGVTHQGIFDIAFLRGAPNLVVMAPSDGRELEEMLEFAFTLSSPVAIRYPKDKIKNEPQSISSGIELGKAEILKKGRDFVIIALGSMVCAAQQAVGFLEKEGLEGTLLNARFVKPLDSELFKKVAAGHKKVFTIEEGILNGGFGSAISEILDKPVFRIGLPDEFIPHGRRDILLNKHGLNANAIAEKIKAELWRK